MMSWWCHGFTKLDEIQRYKLGEWSLKDMGLSQSGTFQDISRCIMGNVGSSVFLENETQPLLLLFEPFLSFVKFLYLITEQSSPFSRHFQAWMWQPDLNILCSTLIKGGKRRHWRDRKRKKKDREWEIEVDSRRGRAKRGAKERVRQSFLGTAPWSAAHSRKINWSCFLFFCFFFQSGELPLDYRETAVHSLPLDSACVIMHQVTTKTNRQGPRSSCSDGASTPFWCSFHFTKPSQISI